MEVGAAVKDSGFKVVCAFEVTRARYRPADISQGDVIAMLAVPVSFRSLHSA